MLTLPGGLASDISMSIKPVETASVWFWLEKGKQKSPGRATSRSAANPRHPEEEKK